METINQKIMMVQQALNTLHESMSLCLDNGHALLNIPRQTAHDSMIQRFKYSAYSFWEIIRDVVEYELGDVYMYSGYEIFHKAVEIGILTKSHEKLFVRMMRLRREVVENYHQEIAESIAHEIPAFYEAMKAIADRIWAKIE